MKNSSLITIIVVLSISLIAFACSKKEYDTVQEYSKKNSSVMLSSSDSNFLISAKKMHFELDIKSIPRLKKVYGTAQNWEKYINDFKSKKNGMKSNSNWQTENTAGLFEITGEYSDGILYSGNQSVKCNAYTYIFDAIEEAGRELIYCDRAGASSACAAKLRSGMIDQSEQNFLSDCDMEAGWFLPCVAYPLSNVDAVFDNEVNYYIENNEGLNQFLDPNAPCQVFNSGINLLNALIDQNYDNNPSPGYTYYISNRTATTRSCEYKWVCGKATSMLFSYVIAQSVEKSTHVYNNYYSSWTFATFEHIGVDEVSSNSFGVGFEIKEQPNSPPHAEIVNPFFAKTTIEIKITASLVYKGFPISIYRTYPASKEFYSTHP
ncbi:MAG: 2Fe-2S iron-sulfur cluster-binding protein [Chitinophagaceae bacterium]